MPVEVSVSVLSVVTRSQREARIAGRRPAITPDTTAIAKRNWDKSPHGKKIRLEIGPAIQTIEKLPGPFDLVFIDADKSGYLDYLRKLLPLVRPGGLILAHNMVRPSPDPDFVKAIALTLDELGESPVIVRSSMLPRLVKSPQPTPSP